MISVSGAFSKACWKNIVADKSLADAYGFGHLRLPLSFSRWSFGAAAHGSIRPPWR